MRGARVATRGPGVGAGRVGRFRATGAPGWDAVGVAEPSGTMTFLFTDIEGSTRLWQQGERRMRAALSRHDELLRGAVAEHGGRVFSTMGDGVAAAFSCCSMAVAAALAAQRSLGAEAWPTATPLRVRMGLHTGEADAAWRGLFRHGGEPGGPADGGRSRRASPVSSTTAELLGEVWYRWSIWASTGYGTWIAPCTSSRSGVATSRRCVRGFVPWEPAPAGQLVRRA